MKLYFSSLSFVEFKIYISLKPRVSKNKQVERFVEFKIYISLKQTKEQKQRFYSFVEFKIYISLKSVVCYVIYFQSFEEFKVYISLKPKITLYGNSTSRTSLTIGNQVVRLKQLSEKLVIECKQGEQNVYDKNGNLLNSVMLGAFFEIKPGVSGIVLGSGITRLEIECRWGAFV